MPVFLFYYTILLTLKLLAWRWGDLPLVWELQMGCPRFGPGGSSSLCPLGTGTRFCYNKSSFRNSLLAPVLACAFKPLGRGGPGGN